MGKCYKKRTLRHCYERDRSQAITNWTRRQEVQIEHNCSLRLNGWTEFRRKIHSASLYRMSLSQFPLLTGRWTKSMPWKRIERVLDRWWLNMCLEIAVSLLCLISFLQLSSRFADIFQATRAYCLIDYSHGPARNELFYKIKFRYIAGDKIFTSL